MICEGATKRVFVHCDMDGSSRVFACEQVWYWEEGARPHTTEAGKRLLTLAPARRP